MEIKDQVMTLHISLNGSSPLIWRRIDVSAKMTLRGLHRVIQGAFMWNGSHLYSYRIGEEQYGDTDILDDDFELKNDQNRRLFQVYNKGLKNFSYNYDFGDNWEHDIQIEEVKPPRKGVRYPICTAGELDAPIDDSGGVFGYQRMLEIMEDPTHPDYEETREWPGGDFYGQIKFSIDDINDFCLQRRKILTR